MASAAPKPHVVRHGEYLTALAFRAGTTVEAILADPKNGEIKKSRHPEILNPGDIVYLPDPREDPPSLDAQTDNAFTADVPMVEVHVTLKGRDGKPVAGQQLASVPVVSETPLETDGSGKVTFKVPVHIKNVRLSVKKTGVQFDVRIGHLDPHGERSGLLSRLRQLGYVADENSRITGRAWLGATGSDLDARVLAQAIAAFQSAHGMEITGTMDEALCAAVRDEHGC